LEFLTFGKLGFGNSGTLILGTSGFGNSGKDGFGRGGKSSFGSWGMFDSRRMCAPAILVLLFVDNKARNVNIKMIVDKLMEAIVWSSWWEELQIDAICKWFWYALWYVTSCVICVA